MAAMLEDVSGAMGTLQHQGELIAQVSGRHPAALLGSTPSARLSV